EHVAHVVGERHSGGVYVWFTFPRQAFDSHPESAHAARPFAASWSLRRPSRRAPDATRCGHVTFLQRALEGSAGPGASGADRAGGRPFGAAGDPWARAQFGSAWRGCGAPAELRAAACPGRFAARVMAGGADAGSPCADSDGGAAAA